MCLIRKEIYYGQDDEEDRDTLKMDELADMKRHSSQTHTDLIIAKPSAARENPIDSVDSRATLT